ncbi:MAG: tetratricopeptide repeat protein [Bryobacterales bacterium]|nr:tetratricopeptide repeat protein [Bryobacterales bacterium]
MMRLIAPVLLFWAQLDKPPSFDERPAFQKPAAGPLDSSAHVSGRAEAAASQLALQIDRFAPSPPDTAFEAARALLRQGHLAAAAASFEEGAAREPKNDALHAGVAITQFLTGHYDASAASLLELVRSTPRDARLIPLLGETAGSAPPARRAAYVTALRQFAAAFPRSGEPRYYLAQLLAAGVPTPPAEAVALWTEAARLDPHDARPCLELARTATARPTEAIRWLEQALQRDPALPDAHFRLSQLYLRQGDRPRAAQHLQRYRELRQQTPQDQTTDTKHVK